MIATLLVLVIVLSLLVFVHEFGHFVTAKLSGIKVEEFGFGFPPRIAGFKRGETVYSVNWIPLGGFVKIKGESGGDAHERDSFSSRKPWQRAVILCAGVAMNVVLAWFLLTVGYLIGLPQVAEDLPAGARVANAKIQIYSVLKNSPADMAGFQTGDALIAVDGKLISGVEDFRAYTASHEGVPVAVSVSRDGASIEQPVVPKKLSETGQPGIGIAIVKTGLVSYPFYLAPIEGADATISFVREIFVAFYGLFRDLFTSRAVSVEFSGPVGIAVLTAEMVKLGFRYLLQFTALLSVNLAVINILPLPALDGGRVLFLVIEKLRGRAVSARIENMTHNIGFALLMLLVLVITYQDVVKFGDKIRQTLSSFLGF